MLNLKQFLEQNNNLDDKVKENQGESSADKSKKPNQATQTADKATAKTDQDKAKDSIEKQKMQMRQNRAKAERAKAQARSSQQVAKQVAGGGIRRERTSSSDDSIKATGKAGMNMGKSLVKTARTVASVPFAIRARNKKAKVGRVMKGITGEPTGGTKTQIARDAISKGIGNVRRRLEIQQKRSTPVSQRIAQNNSSTNKPTPKPTTSTTPSLKDRMAAGYDKNKSRILRNEDFIHEAEKGDKKIEKEKIDVMKGKNKVEVNPKVQAEAKKMTKRQIEKRDEIADAISTREMNKRYGDKNVKYAIATRLAMKKKKKKKIDEAKEEGKYISNLAKSLIRNKRRFGDTGSTEPTGRTGQGTSSATTMTVQRGEEHKARRGVKNESVSGIEVQNVSDGIKFREYEFIDVVKPEPMRSPKNNITWTEGVKRDEYGDPVGGPKISKKEKQKNLAKDDKDEKITRSEETINELYGETATRAYEAANLKSQKATNNKTKNKAHRQAQKFVAYADKKYRKLNQDRSNIAKTYNKSDEVKEAKMPVQGLMKLAATVAANKKKRKNALQIQKYIGEGRRGQSKSSYNRNPYDNVTSSVKKIARTGVGPGIEITNPDEEQGIIQRRSEAEKIRQKKRDEIDKKKAEFKKKRKGLMAKGEIQSPDPK